VKDHQSDTAHQAAQDGDTTWSEWRWSGTRSDGQAVEMRGVTLFEITDGQIAAGRLYLEDAERDVASIEQAVEALSGHPAAVRAAGRRRGVAAGRWTRRDHLGCCILGLGADGAYGSPSWTI
jgi:SnoaL-like protein